MYDIVYVKPRAETLRIHSSFLGIGYQMQMEEYQMHPLLNTGNLGLGEEEEVLQESCNAIGSI